MEQSERERARVAEAKKANSLLNVSEIQLETADDVQGIARDLDNENIFDPDDNVVLKNIFDGSTVNGFKLPTLDYVHMYNGVKYRTTPGQVYRLPGSQAFLAVKHLVSLIYRRIEGKDEMDKRTYPMTDKWVRAIVVKVDKTLRPEGIDRDQVQDVPDYNAMDEDYDRSNELPGRLAGAVGAGGGGETELAAVNMNDAPMTDDQFNKTPDFAPNLNPNVQFDGSGKPVDTSKKPQDGAGSDAGSDDAPFGGQGTGGQQNPPTPATGADGLPVVNEDMKLAELRPIAEAEKVDMSGWGAVGFSRKKAVAAILENRAQK